MAKKYFSKFPVISYNGYNVRNLTVAAKVVDRYTNLPYTYDQFEVKREERADLVADKYYGDSYMSWVIYYANKIVDPYYGWCLSEIDFNNHLNDLNGSLEDAQTRIVEFRSNWYNDDRTLTPSRFTALFGDYAEPHSKYWDPIYSESSDNILYYERKKSDHVINTNKLLRISVSNNEINKFSNKDLIDFKTPDRSMVVATGEVCLSNSTSLTIKNYLGDLISNNYVIALDSDANTYVTISNYSAAQDFSSAVWTITNISDEEYIYWTPFTSYDIQREKNESLKNIKMIDPISSKMISDRLEEELKST